MGPDSLETMSRVLGVPVSIDETGWLRSGVELRFTRRQDRTIHPVVVRVGVHANLADVLALGDVRDRCARYNDVLRSLRRLRDQLRVLIGGTELKPVRLAAEVSESRVVFDASCADLLRFEELIARRQARCMGYGTVRVDTLDLEIGFLRGQHDCLVPRVLQLHQARGALSAVRHHAPTPTYAGQGGTP